MASAMHHTCGVGAVLLWMVAVSCAPESTLSPLPSGLTGDVSAGGASACPPDATQCGDTCVSLATSAAHCGACDVSCAPDAVCEDGQCQCGVGFSPCGGACVDLLGDGQNCGSCGVACVDQVCSKGVCSTSCETGTICGTSCVDVRTDSRNCGGCGIVCAAGLSCVGRECACPTGFEACDGVTCVDLSIDPAHCGSCGVACEPGAPCSAGVCETLSGTGGSAVADGTGGVESAAGGVSGGAADPTGGATAVTGGARWGTTGGATGVGGGTRTTGGSTGSTGGAGPGSVAYTVGASGYVTVCGWQGFAFTGAGPDNLSTIRPASFANLAAGAELCASGTVGADPNYSGYALLGINIGQPDTGADEPPNAELVPQGTGLYVSVTNNASSSFRIQIQDASGETDAAHRWCAVYSGPGVIPWSSFNTACWDNSGSAYAGGPINAVLVMVPGNTTATPFDFCIDEIRPQGAPGCAG
jgi:hypothetical protein